jgi:hypothetical protein
VTGPVRLTSVEPPIRAEPGVDVRTRTVVVDGVRYEWVGPLADVSEVLVIEHDAVVRTQPVAALLTVMR